MSAVPDRQTLENLKRVDLQRLCKDHGLKANLKSEALIDLLLETSKPIPPPQAPAPKRLSSLRVISRSSAGSRPRGRSGGSVIIHDTDEEEEEGEEALPNETGSIQSESAHETKPDPPVVPVTRSTRKAKETQYRLGVGRPALAGGSGARAVTKSISISKGKRGKPSRSIQPTEAVIREEEEEESEPRRSAPPETSHAGPSGASHATPTVSPTPPTNAASPALNIAKLESYVAEIVNPLRSHIQSLQSELQQLSSRTADLKTLQSKVTELTSEVEILRKQVSDSAQLENQLEALQDEIIILKRSMLSDSSRVRSESGETAGKSRAADRNNNAAESIHQVNHPGHAASSLGKRQRDSETSEVVEVEGEGGVSNEEPTKRGLRPSKKRLKLSSDNKTEAGQSSSHQEPVAGGDAEDGEEDEIVRGAVINPAGPRFTIFNGPEEPPESFDPPPPTTRLSDLFNITASTPDATPPSGVATSTANAHENQQPTTGDPNSAFGFSFTNSIFQPITSTPAATAPFGLAMLSFPYPEAPTSPTPVGPAITGAVAGSGRRERDLYQGLGLSRPSRPRSAASRPHSRASHTQQRFELPGMSGPSGQGELTISPAALMNTPALPTLAESESEGISRRPTIHAASLGHGIAPVLLPIPPDTPGAPMKRTMYGTELEGDTRFGDFGYEGVGTGFWTGAAPHF